MRTMPFLHKNCVIVCVLSALGLVGAVFLAHVAAGDHFESCSACEMAQHFSALGEDPGAQPLDPAGFELISAADRGMPSTESLLQTRPRAPPLS